MHNRFRPLLAACLIVAALPLIALADTISTNLQFLIMDSGSHSNDWGTQTNANLGKVESAIAGITSLSVTGGTTTLSQDQARAAALAISGTLTADQILIVPSVSKWWIVSNQATLGGHVVQMKTAGGSALTVPASTSQNVLVWCDGTVVSIVADVSAQITSLTASVATNTSNLTTATATANAALPKAGGTMTGDLVLYGSAPATSASAPPKSYVDSAVAAAVPSGAVMAFNLGSCPTGWAAANGSGGTVDLRGEFVRGLDSGRGVDSGRTLGTAQGDLVKDHTHGVTELASIGGAGTPTAGVIGAQNAGTWSYTTDGMSSGGGTETRPRNVALLYCQKT